MQTEHLGPDDIPRAAALLRAGGLVAFPTETVYGLGADAGDDRAVAGIFEAKGRPRFNPLIVHLPEAAAAEAYALFPAAAQALAEQFWPGPMTLVLPRRPGARLSELVSAGNPSIALRVPAHPLARALLHAAGCPVAAPSANPSGRVSPTTAAHVMAGLSGRIDAVLDGGACPVGVESTILACTPDGAVSVLRDGGLAREEIEACLAEAGAPGLVAHRPDPGTAPVAPGQLASHYAPGAFLRLGAKAPAPGEAWLGFGPDPVLPGGTIADTLSASGDLRDAAAALFATLRDLDARLGGSGRIAVAPVPERGLGRAINDRLRRAAAPRPD